MIIPPGFVNVEFRMHNTVGHACQFGWAWAVTSDPTQAHADTLSSHIGAPLTNILSTVSTYDGLRMLIGQDGPPLELLSVNGTGAGGRGITMCPAQVQHLMDKRTGLVGRKFRGRAFIPDVSETHTGQNGIMDSTELGLIQALRTALTSGLPSEFGQSVILHNDETEPTTVVTINTEQKVATLRRRWPRQ
jgi:hypothetical protein